MIVFADELLECGPVERRIVAAEVAIEDRLPAIAKAFLARIDQEALLAAAPAVRERFLRALRGARAKVLPALAQHRGLEQL